MAYVTGQSFQEAVDGSRTVFSFQQAVDTDAVQVYQGSLPLEPTAFWVISATQVRTLDLASQTSWTCDAVTSSTVEKVGHSISASTILFVWSTVTDGLPSGLEEGQAYYVLAVDADHFQLSLTDGGAAVSFESTSSGTLRYSEVLAPEVADGALWYSAVLLGEVIDPSLVVGFWEIQEWQTQYAPLAGSGLVVDLLTDADTAVQEYVTAASYAEAETQIGTAVYPYRLFRRVIGELALFYLSRRPGGVQVLKSATKQYGDTTKKMSQTYDTSILSIRGMSEQDILAQLFSYREEPEEIDFTVEHPFTRTWGTGRNFGILAPTRDVD